MMVALVDVGVRRINAGIMMGEEPQLHPVSRHCQLGTLNCSDDQQTLKGQDDCYL